MKSTIAIRACGVLLALAATSPSAQTPPERHTSIGYDNTGRVASVETAIEESAPTMTGVFPAVVRHGPAVAVTITGASLRGAVPTASDPGLTITAVTAEAARVTLTLQANESVPLGEQHLTLTTVLGSADVPFTVRPRLSVLSASA